MINIIKSSGNIEEFSCNKIQKFFLRAVRGTLLFQRVDDKYNILEQKNEQECFDRFVNQLLHILHEGIESKDLYNLSIKICINNTSIEEPFWEKIAARMLLGNLYKNVARQRKVDFSLLYIENLLFTQNMIDTKKYHKDVGRYNIKIDPYRDLEYGYTTVLGLYKRYLLKDGKKVIELPQELYAATASRLMENEEEAQKAYDLCSKQMISLPTPTLQNARTPNGQLASCFILNVGDDINSIFNNLYNAALISKNGGGLGVYLGHIRSRGASIRGVQGASGGVLGWIKLFNDTAVAVNQLGSRLGAISVTLDVWHRDIYDFLDMQTETGDIRTKSFNVFPAVAFPDIFMERVKKYETWTLIDPHEYFCVYGKRIEDYYGEEFEEKYVEAENDNRLTLNKKVDSVELFKKYLKTVAETGMPYSFFRDTANKANPQKKHGMIYASNLCTEISQNTSNGRFVQEYAFGEGVYKEYKYSQIVTCNLASINVSKVNTQEDCDLVYPILLKLLDNVIDKNEYPLVESKETAAFYRPIGIGYLGLAEYLATHKFLYDTQEARDEVEKLFKMYQTATYKYSEELGNERGIARCNSGINKYRFGYHTSPAPNTSTAGIVGTTAALLPIYKKFFMESNLSSSTVRIAPNINKENFWYYKEYGQIDMKQVIKMIATIQKYVDQAISFEWQIDPEKTTPKDLYDYYMLSWESGLKTVYYVRSFSSSSEKCASCSG